MPGRYSVAANFYLTRDGMFKKAEITIKYTVDLDPVAGWGDNAADWINLATEAVLRQTHYNTKAETVLVDVLPRS
jgi:hypothetical protein